MFALRALDGAAYALSHTEETGTRPMGPSDLTGDNREGPIAPAVPFEPVGMDKHGIGDAAPFAASRVPAFNKIGGAGFCASLASESRFRRSSLRMIDLERPPSGLSWSLYVIPRIRRAAGWR